MEHPRHAFSLIELSIVLVILGLLTGGILAGKSLIRASELRSVVTENDRYRTAMFAFRDKYFALPGDFAMASKFWGAAGGNGSNNACYTALANVGTSGSCDGDGDGFVPWNNSNNRREDMLVWNHLANGGLIEGSYSYYTGGNSPIVGTNVARSRVSSAAGWGMCYMNQGNYGHGYGHLLTLAAPGWSTNACSMGNSSGLKSEEAWGIDKKLDDGLAGTGRVTAANAYNAMTGCLSDSFGAESQSSTYDLQTNGDSCRLFWRLDT
jgi:prepilin-type N-terminal cleavage/methylation domain-containing protein